MAVVVTMPSVSELTAKPANVGVFARGSARPPKDLRGADRELPEGRSEPALSAEPSTASASSHRRTPAQTGSLEVVRRFSRTLRGRYARRRRHRLQRQALARFFRLPARREAAPGGALPRDRLGHRQRKLPEVLVFGQQHARFGISEGDDHLVINAWIRLRYRGDVVARGPQSEHNSGVITLIGEKPQGSVRPRLLADEHDLFVSKGIGGGGHTISQLVQVLSQLTRHPVIDKTGLSGLYDHALRVEEEPASRSIRRR